MVKTIPFSCIRFRLIVTHCLVAPTMDFPEKDNENWFCHTLLSKRDGKMTSEKRAVEPYVVPIADDEKDLYDKQRIRASA